MNELATQRARLRRASDVILPGFRERTPAQEFSALAQWCEANEIVHDLYGEGDILAQFEGKVARILGKEAAVFMPSGVMAQMIAIRIWTEQQAIPRFGFQATSHLALHEEEAYQALFRLHGVPLGNRLQPIAAADVKGLRQPLGCLLVELPSREIGGQSPEWADLQELKEAARQQGLPLHMDGARLWECRAFYGQSHSAIAQGFDSVYVSTYKGIGGLAGAVLAGDHGFILQARLWQRRMGGTLIRQSPMVLSAAMRFDARLEALDGCYQRALALANGLAALPGVRVNPRRPQANLLHLFFDAPADRVNAARDRIAAEQRTWVINDAKPAEVPGWSRTELYVGDTLQERDNASVLPLFGQLLG
jgi:threonine aldolase